jgi:hypothetical protein
MLDLVVVGGRKMAVPRVETTLICFRRQYLVALEALTLTKLRRRPTRLETIPLKDSYLPVGAMPTVLTRVARLSLLLRS